MNKRMNWLMVAVLLVGVLAFQAAPAEAQFPARWSMVMVDFFGFTVDCLDIGNCSGRDCPGTLYLSNLGAGASGQCTEIEEFEGGKTRTQCIFRNLDYSFFAPNTKQVDLDIVCSRWGSVWYGVGGFGPATCGVTATQRRIDQFGANVTFNESYTVATIGSRRKCSTVFATLTEEEIKEFDIREHVRKRRR